MQQVSALEMEWGKTTDIDQSNEKELSLFYIVLFFVRFHLNTLFYIATQKKKKIINISPSPAAKSPFKSIKYQHISALFCKK